MKFLILLFSLYCISEVKASTCSIMIEENAEQTAGSVGSAVTNSPQLLNTRNLTLTDVTDVGSDQFNFTLEIDPVNSDSENNKYIMMNISSQKLLQKIYGPEGRGKSCNTDSTIIFSSFSFLKTTYSRTAKQLIQNLPPCEVLLELEMDAIRNLKCI